MSTFDGNNFYFSGQGVVLVGNRDAAGKPSGLVPVGNVSALKLGLATTVIEHKESQTGNRAIDLRLITELKSSISFTIENFSSIGLSNAVAGGVTYGSGGTVTTGQDTPKLYYGKVTGFANPQLNLSGLTVKRSTGTAQLLTAYTNDATPYDYRINLAAGSLMMNDGSVTALDKATTGNSSITAPTGIAVGATTTFTWAATPPSIITAGAGVGGRLVVSGLAGADAALLNNKSFLITAFDNAAKTVTVACNTVGKTITIGTPLLSCDSEALDLVYTYNAYNQVDPMTSLTTEKWLRFEGLNTADGGNPVIVDCFRFLVDPLKELLLIGENIGQFQLDGNVLADSLQLTGSKFFRVRMLR